MPTWKPDPRIRRIAQAAGWTFIIGVPVLALFFPDLWDMYFGVLILSALSTLPFWWGHLFRRNIDTADPPTANATPSAEACNKETASPSTPGEPSRGL